MAARLVAALALIVACAGLLTTSTKAQPAAQADAPRSLEQAAPALHARLVGLERAHGVLYGALLSGKGQVNEADVLQRMLQRVSDYAGSARPDSEADQGFAALGARGAAIVRRTHALHREVLAIFATVPAAERRRSLDAAVERYRSRPDVALPDVPKDMAVLYDHPYSSFVAPGPGELEPRRELVYPRVTGVVWASHWYELAAQEPLDRFDDVRERGQGLAIVGERFERKLTAGKLPDSFPTELPLAPSIAPGLVAVHERSAAIIDNMNMMLDVLADVLAHPAVPDRRRAVDEVIERFTERDYRCVQAEEWITMALRHSIFQQGGPALGTMTANERSGVGGHMQHVSGLRRVAACDPE